jgi:hypothetical protein
MSEVSNNLLRDVVQWQSSESAQDRAKDSDAAVKLRLVSLRKSCGSPARRALKRVASSVVDCALAHWYMVPGLQFQRFRVRFEIKRLFREKQLPISVRSLVLDRPPDPASYLGFHFASQFLGDKTLGNYLDVSSPWLFPFALVSNFRAANVTLLTEKAIGIRSLARGLRTHSEKEIRFVAKNVPLQDESYDTISSLWDAHEDSKRHVHDVRSLRRLLKPGGTLLLSVPCVRKIPEVTSANGPWIYDANALERYVFDVLGQPKRYAIYGAQTSRIGNEPVCGDPANASDRWAASLAIGRDWRCYSSLQELPGSGVIVMKFTRRESNSEKASIELRPHLN